LEIEIQLSRVLKSREVKPSNVMAIQALVGGDHGNTAFNFEATTTAKLQDGEQLYFKVCCCELNCRKDMLGLFKKATLSRLTTGLKTISM
jgi:hypothetical protein